MQYRSLLLPFLSHQSEPEIVDDVPLSHQLGPLLVPFSCMVCPLKVALGPIPECLRGILVIIAKMGGHQDDLYI